MLIGYSGGNYATTGLSGNFLGSKDDQMGFDLSDGLVYIDATVQNPGSPNPVLINETVTIRLDIPANGNDGIYENLVGNVARTSGNIPSAAWTGYNGIVFAVGNYYSTSDEQGEIEILKPADYTFPLGVGYTFIRAM